ncbi:MAG: hypothetical protein FRX49_12739 [Trebouxia sp. A1-2]|nr:MAG: hypothetical protein FRX49_12739 [Trebouxia sp. A1-2]
MLQGRKITPEQRDNNARTHFDHKIDEYKGVTDNGLADLLVSSEFLQGSRSRPPWWVPPAADQQPESHSGCAGPIQMLQISQTSAQTDAVKSYIESKLHVDVKYPESSMHDMPFQ